MQAKKIISLLLTAAISFASSISVFAAPVEGYKQVSEINDNLANAMTQAIQDGASYADTEKIRADFTVEKITDAEVIENYGLESIADAEVEPDMEGKGYKVTISLKDIGTLVRDTKAGFLMTRYGFIFNSKNDASYHVIPLPYSYNEQLTGDNFSLAANPNGYNITYAGSDSKYATSYPSTLNSTATNCDNAITLVVYADEGTVLTIDDAYAQFANVEYKSMQYKLLQEGTNDPCDTAKYSLWVPETITLGEGGEDKSVTTQTATNGALQIKYGADVPAAEQTLAGMFIAMHDEDAPKGSINKDSRVVVTYTDTDGLGLSKSVEYGKTIFKHLGLDDSDGTITVQKAIKFGVVYEDARYKAANFSFEIK